MKTTIQVDDVNLTKRTRELLAKVRDLRVPLELIRESWFKGNRSIFAISGPGRWPDLAETYKREKDKAVGFIYPILLRTGHLKAALTEPGHRDSISRVIGMRTLELGVNENIGKFRGLYYGVPEKNVKARPYIILGVEQVSPPELNRRTDAWKKMITDYVLDVARASNG